MKNPNLISWSDRKPEERTAIARRGGIVSGVKRRKNRDMIDALKTLMQAKIKDETGQLVFVSEAVAETIVCGALDGDYRFSRLLFDYLHGKPATRQEPQEAVNEEPQKITFCWADTVTLKANPAHVREQLADMDDDEFQRLVGIIEEERQKRGV